MLNHILLRCPYATAAVKTTCYRLQYGEDPEPEYNDETGAVPVRTVSRSGSRISTVQVGRGLGMLQDSERRGSTSLSPIPGSVQVGSKRRLRTSTPDLELIIKKSRSTSPASSIASSSGQQQFITVPAKHKAFSQIEKEEFQLQMARAVYSAGLAERAVEDPEFRRMIQLANPMAPIPNRQQIGGPLLKKLVAISNEESASLIKGKQITFCIDGWENIKNEKIVEMVVNFRGRCLTFGVEDVTGLPKTGEELKRLAVAQIRTLEDPDGIWQTEVIAVCADEGGDCRKAKALLEEIFPTLITLPCWAHQVIYLNAYNNCIQRTN